jgi:ABC-type nitrate/sulfonate/bicarbonate transport system permease component
MMAGTTLASDSVGSDEVEEGVATRPGRVVSTGRLDYPRRQRVTIGSISLVGFFLIWEAATRFTDVNPIFLPTLSSIRDAIIVSHRSGALLPNVWISVSLFVMCIVLSMVIAVPLGILVGAVEPVNRTFGTWFWTIYTTPRIVFIPLILIWFGYSTTAKVVLIVISAAPPAIVMIMEGVKTVEGSMLRAARSFGASRFDQLRKVVLPGTLPYVGTGIRMGVARGLVGLFGAEIFTGRSGVGFLLVDAQTRYNVALVFGALAIYLLMSMSMVGSSSLIEKRLSRWRD